MTNDDKLRALFQDAAADAPPPGFGSDDVVAASRRITVRRRSALVVGAVVLVAVAGVGSVVVGARDQETVAGSAAPVNAPRAENGTPLVAGADAARAPLGPGTTDCADLQDPQLRAVVEEGLPEIAGAPAVATVTICTPGGARGVSVQVADGSATGVLTVSYLPPGAIPSLVPGAISAPTASGGTVIVLSTPDDVDDRAPFVDRLSGLLTFLAPRL